MCSDKSITERVAVIQENAVRRVELNDAFDYEPSQAEDDRAELLSIVGELQESEGSYEALWEHAAQSALANMTQAKLNLTRAEQAEGVIAVMRPYMRHREYCRGYPATCEEDVAKNCDCGLQSIIRGKDEEKSR